MRESGEQEEKEIKGKKYNQISDVFLQRSISLSWDGSPDVTQMLLVMGNISLRDLI